MTLSIVKVGGWAFGETLDSDQMNDLQDELIKAIDGVGGGTYTLTAPLIIDGDTFRIDQQLYINFGATLQADGDIHVRSGATLFCQAGSALDVSDNAIFSGASTFDGTHVDLVAGTALRIDDPNDLVVQGWLETLYLPLVAWNTAGAGNWDFDPLSNGGVLNTSLSSLEIYFVLPANAGDEIRNIRVQIQGGAGAGHGGVDPSSKLRVRLYESPSAGSGGGYTNIASLTDPATGAAYDARHNVTLNPGYVAVASRYYLVGIRGESGGTAASNENLIEKISVDVVKNQVVSTHSYMSG